MLVFLVNHGAPHSSAGEDQKVVIVNRPGFIGDCLHFLKGWNYEQNDEIFPEIRERAVWMVFEHQAEDGSQWAAMGSISVLLNPDEGLLLFDRNGERGPIVLAAVYWARITPCNVPSIPADPLVTLDQLQGWCGKSNSAKTPVLRTDEVARYRPASGAAP